MRSLINLIEFIERPVKMIDFNEHELLIIGGSVGSTEILMDFIPKLPGNFQLAVVIVVHRKGSVNNLLSKILDEKAVIRVKEVDEKERIEVGTVYVAPGDYHLLIERDKTFSLDSSEKIINCRPSIDLAFQQAAGVYKNRLIGILLTGANKDGAEGLKCIANSGGVTIVQDPQEAEVNIMPQAACELFEPSMVLTAAQLLGLFSNIT